MMNEKNSENCEEVRMSYREYKENYADRKTKSGSYDKEEKPSLSTFLNRMKKKRIRGKCLEKL